MDIVITLTQEQEAALREMLKEQTLQEWLNAILAAHINGSLDSEWNQKTPEEKAALLK